MGSPFSPGSEQDSDLTRAQLAADRFRKAVQAHLNGLKFASEARATFKALGYDSWETFIARELSPARTMRTATEIKAALAALDLGSETSPDAMRQRPAVQPAKQSGSKKRDEAGADKEIARRVQAGEPLLRTELSKKYGVPEIWIRERAEVHRDRAANDSAPGRKFSPRDPELQACMREAIKSGCKNESQAAKYCVAHGFTATSSRRAYGIITQA